MDRTKHSELKPKDGRHRRVVDLCVDDPEQEGARNHGKPGAPQSDQEGKQDPTKDEFLDQPRQQRFLQKRRQKAARASRGGFEARDTREPALAEARGELDGEPEPIARRSESHDLEACLRDADGPGRRRGGRWRHDLGVYRLEELTSACGVGPSGSLLGWLA